MSAIFLSLTKPAISLSRFLLERLRNYWILIKDLQTGLLLFTALAGYISGCCLNLSTPSLGALVGSLFLTISGSTILNMVYDCDIDALMRRTIHRPLPSGKVSIAEALVLGISMSSLGIGWGFYMNVNYGVVLMVGLVFDVLIYTIWLKRRTPYAIIWGGLAGGMPALAGRTLAMGYPDTIGLLMAAGVLLWIPTHIMTFNIKHASDYQKAAIPTFPSIYGDKVTRLVIAGSSLASVCIMLITGNLIGLPLTHLWGLTLLGLLLLLLVIAGIIRPGKTLNFTLYKGASIYMLVSMLVIIYGGL